MALNQASRGLRAIAAFYLGFPVTYLAVAAVLFNLPVRALLGILLNPSYYLFSGFCVVAGYGILALKRWGWHVFQIALFLTVYENATLLVVYGQTNHRVLSFAFSALVLAAVWYRVAREIRVPYFFPRIRWWEANPRYRFSTPVRVHRADGSAIEGEILDISLGGCFVKSREEVKEGEPLRLEFSLFGHPLLCDGAAVWRAASAVTHPKGVGIRFAELRTAERRALRVAMKRLRRLAQLYRQARYLISHQEFQSRWKQIHDGPAATRLRLRQKRVTRLLDGGDRPKLKLVGGKEANPGDSPGLAETRAAATPPPFRGRQGGGGQAPT